MTSIARLVSISALAGTLVAPLLFLGGRLPLDQVKLWMLVSAVAWFAATPLWMKRDS